MKKKTKIPYSEEAAADAMARHNLPPNVKKVWKSRGHIPGAYFEEGAVDASKRLSDNDPEYAKFVEVLNLREIASSNFRTLGGQKGPDVARGKDRMTEAERLGLKTEIVEIRNKFRRAMDTMSESALKTALVDLRVKPTIIIGVALYRRVHSATPLAKDEKEAIRMGLAKFYNNIKI